jgi:hypothetical protein
MKTTDFIKENELIGQDAHDMHQDHQHQMLREECYHIAVNSVALHKLLKQLPEHIPLDAWAAEKISLANDYIKTVKEWLEYDVMGAGKDVPSFNPALAESKLAESLNEVNPHNYDSDEDYYNALNAPAKPKYRGQQSPGVDPDDEAYFRDIFRKKREAAKKAEQDKDQGVAEGIDWRRDSADLMQKIASKLATEHVKLVGTPKFDNNRDKWIATVKTGEGKTFKIVVNPEGVLMGWKRIDALGQQGVAEDSLNEFAPTFGGGGDGDDKNMVDILMSYMQQNYPKAVKQYGSMTVYEVINDRDSMGYYRPEEMKNKDLDDLAIDVLTVLEDIEDDEQGMAEGKRTVKENATGGATGASSVAVSMTQEGNYPAEMVARQKTYSNQRTKGGTVKVKAAKK